MAIEKGAKETTSALTFAKNKDQKATIMRVEHPFIV